MEDISFAEAQALIAEHLRPLPPKEVPVEDSGGLVLAETPYGRFDVPGGAISLKDGYAVRSEDIRQASPQNPVPLRLKGEVFAGARPRGEVRPGEAVRVTSGALIPKGANAVLAEEFARRKGEFILALADAFAGRNILFAGEDIKKGRPLLSPGTILSPPEVGLLAAGGITTLRVYPRPRVLVVATGDEVVFPGRPVPPGKVVASNLVTIYAWLKKFGFSVAQEVVPDEPEAMKRVIFRFLEGFDALLTSGGAWKGERDLIVRILDELGWKKVFHRLRLGPGKALAFGLFAERPVFCLPGGPPSNQAAFLLLALPGLLRLAGQSVCPFPRLPAILEREVKGEVSWTQVFFGRLHRLESRFSFLPLKPKSRLQYLSEAEALFLLPEGLGRARAGEIVEVQVLKERILP